MDRDLCYLKQLFLKQISSKNSITRHTIKFISLKFILNWKLKLKILLFAEQNLFKRLNVLLPLLINIQEWYVSIKRVFKLREFIRGMKEAGSKREKIKKKNDSWSNPREAVKSCQRQDSRRKYPKHWTRMTNSSIPFLHRQSGSQKFFIFKYSAFRSGARCSWKLVIEGIFKFKRNRPRSHSREPPFF